MFPWAFLGFGDSSAGEILVVLAVALLLFGPRRLPSVARQVGRTIENWRRAARDFREELLRADAGPPPPPPPPPAALPPAPDAVATGPEESGEPSAESGGAPGAGEDDEPAS